MKRIAYPIFSIRHLKSAIAVPAIVISLVATPCFVSAVDPDHLPRKTGGTLKYDSTKPDPPTEPTTLNPAQPLTSDKTEIVTALRMEVEKCVQSLNSISSLMMPDFSKKIDSAISQTNEFLEILGKSKEILEELDSQIRDAETQRQTEKDEMSADLQALYQIAFNSLSQIGEQVKALSATFENCKAPVPTDSSDVLDTSNRKEMLDSLTNAVSSLLQRIPENLSGQLHQLAESNDATNTMTLIEEQGGDIVGRLKLLLILVVCALVMLAALGAVLFFGTRSPDSKPAPQTKSPAGSDAPSDWRAQLDAARKAEQQAKSEAQSAREAEREALERANAARSAASDAVERLHQSEAAAGAAEKSAQAAVRAALSAFASCNGLDENAWLTALRDIARGLSESAAARGASPKEGFELLSRWSHFLSQFSAPGHEFDLNLPAIGASIDTSWMTPARAGASKVSRVVTWAVYTKSGVRHNAEVE